MKTLIATVLASGALLSGCVAVPVGEPAVHVSGAVRSGHHHHHHRYHPPPRHRHGYDRPYPARPPAHPGPPRRHHYDRDGDGVPDRHDSRPHNPYRY